MSRNKVVQKHGKIYPSKRNMNLLPRSHVARWLPNFVMYTLLIAAILLGLGKIGVYDIIMDVAVERQKTVDLGKKLEQVNAEVDRYDEVKGEYERYSYGYLSGEELALYDRIELLALLRENVGAYATIHTMAANGNTIRLTCSVADLHAVSEMVANLTQNEAVTSVSVSTASKEENDNEATSIAVALTLTVQTVSAEGGEADD